MKCKYKNCNNQLSGKQKIYCSRSCLLKHSTITNRHKNKVKAVEYKGGSCERCGYNKSLRALQFHHLDPNQKDFHISDSNKTRSWEKVKTELDKCIMLCSNCHAEEHDKTE